MSHPFERDFQSYFILTNSKGENSLWPSSQKIPVGWSIALTERTRDECLKWLDKRTNPPTIRPRESGSKPFITDQFEAQVRSTPEATAIRFSGTSVSYSELNQQANRLARVLRARGVGENDIVGVAMERTPALISAILGVLKSGAAYLPLSLDDPLNRQNTILEDARAVFVLTDGHRQNFELGTVPALAISEEIEDSEIISNELNDRNLDSLHELDHAAYVIYTSGSTGQPKGVVVSHTSLNAFISTISSVVRFAPGNHHVAVASPTFDISVMELLVPLLYGATVVLASTDEIRQPAQLRELVRKHQEVSIHLTPSHWQHFLDHDEQCLVGVRALCGGEAMSAALARRLSSRSDTVWNLYGPTEATICATAHRITAEQDATSLVPIGKPLPGYRVYILDEHLDKVSVGISGELYIAGECLARGYLHRPAMTAERFVADPFGPPGSRMYRSGDIARFRSDGTLEYLGRSDHQVKLRGYRIELGEIEAAVSELPGVAHAVVVAETDRLARMCLTAYVLPHTDALNIEFLRSELATRLPAHMLPASWIIMDHFPLTRNGKVDRQALPPPVRLTISNDQLTPDEVVLAELFSAILKLSGVSRDESFFFLGGDSLLATELGLRIYDRLGVRLNLGEIYGSPTVKELAIRLRAKSAASSLARVLPLRTNGTRLPLFCLPPVGGLGWCYAGLTRSVDSERPIYSLQSRHLADLEAELPASIAEMVEDDLALIRTIQPTGPYHLLGWSFGGYLAHALAVKLQQIGQSVGYLGVMNSFRPRNEPDGGVAETRRALADLVGMDYHSREDLDIKTICEAVRQSMHPLSQLEPKQTWRLLELFERHACLLMDYKPGVFNGPIELYIAAKGSGPIATSEDWEPHVRGQIHTYEINFEHHEMTNHAAMDEIGQLLEIRLQHSNNQTALPARKPLNNC